MVFLVWVVFGLLLSVKTLLEAQFFLPELRFGQVYLSQFYRATFWMILVPAVIYLHRRLPLSGRRRFQNIAIHLGLSFAAMLLNYWVRYYLLFVVPGWMDHGVTDFFLISTARFNFNNLIDIPIYWAIVAGAHAIGLYRRQRDLEMVQSQLQTQVAEAELHALKQQLQPHFLFNALNAVAMLVREKQEDRAVDTLAQLSALLRKLIDNTRQQEVPLDRELDFTQRYLEIEKIRFGDRLEVNYDIPQEYLRALVPSLVLQPLVENAIKHGISRRIAPGRISVAVQAVAQRLQIEVFNDHADDPMPEGPTRVHLGLETTRERLRKSYGADFELTCSFGEPDGARVRVQLPLRFAPQSNRVEKVYSP